MTRAYAEGTAVPVERTKAEIDSLLGKHGATQRGVVADETAERAMIVFVLRERQYRLDVPLPSRAKLPDPTKGSYQQKLECPMRWDGWDAERRRQWVEHEWHQRERERWRAVLLMIKAKLELVRIGVSTVEREFLADLVLPGGKRVAQILEAQMDQILAGETPRLLPEAT